MAKQATRAAYGQAIAQLVQENENIVVLDADLAGSTNQVKRKSMIQKDTLIWELPKAI